MIDRDRAAIGGGCSRDLDGATSWLERSPRAGRARRREARAFGRARRAAVARPRSQPVRSSLEGEFLEALRPPGLRVAARAVRACVAGASLGAIRYVGEGESLLAASA